MKVAPLHPQEALRVESLTEYSILDTIPEQDIDDLTYLVSQICDVPIALVSLVDTDRQWFKSKVGLDADETSRDIAFCSHAILQDEVFYVEDTAKDARFADNPLVTGAPHIRFYAGTPLVGREGLPLGTLCIIDEKPRHLSDEQIISLKAIGRQVMSQLELRRRIKETHLQNERLESLNKQLDKLAQVKTEFLNHVSHELRTPLSALLGLSDVLTQEHPINNNSGEESLENRLHLIYSAAKSLTDMVNHVLDISRLESGKMEYYGELVKLEDLIKEIVAINKVNADKKNISLRVSLKPLDYPSVIIDKVKTTQILINLIGNAIKFTPPNGKVRISIEQHSKELEFEIADKGIGIPRGQLEKIFEAFSQAKQNNEQVAGSGLGLSISKQLADFLQGSLSVTSVEGTGSTFRLTLPFKPGRVVNKIIERSIENLDLSDKTMLLVEDTKVNQLVFKAYIGVTGINLAIAETAEEGLKMLKQLRPDLLILDVRLPDKNGFDLCEEIRQIPEFSDMPVLFFSGDVSQDSFNRSKSCRAIDFLPKPLDRNRLLSHLKEILG